MSKTAISKTSAILIGLSILATSASLAFAKDTQTTATTSAIKPVGAIRTPMPPQRINIMHVESQIENMREKIASKEAILRSKLEKFRDQKKATAAARISTNLNQINQNQTTQMQRYLDFMSGILDKLEIKVNQLTPDIKDPAAAKVAIASARAVIASASAAVSAQAQNDYTIQATTESRIKADAQAMRDKLHKDILFIRKAVVDAKQSVSNAIRIAKSGSVVKLDQEKEGTSSGRE